VVDCREVDAHAVADLHVRGDRCRGAELLERGRGVPLAEEPPPALEASGHVHRVDAALASQTWKRVRPSVSRTSTSRPRSACTRARREAVISRLATVSGLS